MINTVSPLLLAPDSTRRLQDLSPCESHTGFASIRNFKGCWRVLHTRPRNEKAIASVFDRLGISYFLPLVRHKRTCRGRPRYVNLPLFPGYVFLCGNWEAREAALKTNRVVNVLDVADQDRLKADLMQIQRVLESGKPVDLYPGLRVGSRCRVKSGILAGLEGVVLRRRSLWRVYVGVQFIAQSAELEVDSMLLEVID
ncbi:MAG: transcription termination/antitermination NusG family protein [Phycisphaerae bacterium]